MTKYYKSQTWKLITSDPNRCDDTTSPQLTEITKEQAIELAQEVDEQGSYIWYLIQTDIVR